MSRHHSRQMLLTTVVAVIVAVSTALIIKAMGGTRANMQGSKSVIFGIADPELINETAEDQAKQLSAMRSLGISSIRVEANWSSVQPTNPTTFRWSKLDREVRSIRATGMSIDLIIDGCPPWAALPIAAKDPFPQPASSAEYADWASDVAQRYAPAGVNYFEIWNEPNIRLFWHPKPNPVAYTADLKAAYAAIKKVDSSAVIISGGLAPAASNGITYSPISFIQAMYADGAKGSFDELGLHPYSFPLLPNTYNSGSVWSQMDETIPSIRSVMIQHGDADKKIWITEFGAPTTGPSGIGVVGQRTEILQALAYVKKVDWIGSFYIFTWRDVRGNEQGFGLLDILGHPRPAFYAVASAIAKSSP